MKRTLLISFLIVSFIVGHTAFFFFNQKKTDNNNNNEDVVYATLPVSRVRGVTQYDEDKYLSNSEFQCADGKRVISSAMINDEFCDCEDGSDEPGTSACSFVVSKFSCINKGYKTTYLPASRVDDGICDCCDGSDEGNITRCPDTCAKVAAKEREHLEKAAEAYKVGSKILAEVEERVRKDLTARADMYDAHKKELEAIRSKVASLKSLHESQTNQIQSQIDAMKESTKEEVHNMLFPLTQLSIVELGMLMTDVFDILHLDEKAVTNIHNGIHDDADQAHRNRRHHDDEEEDHHHHHHHEEEDHEADPYLDEHEHHHHEVDLDSENIAAAAAADTTTTTTTSSSDPDQNMDIAACQLFQASRDPRMRPFCLAAASALSSDYHHQIITFLVDHLFPSKKPFAIVQLLSGYFQLHRTFTNSKQFVIDLIDSSNNDNNNEDNNNNNNNNNNVGTCPAAFEGLSSDVCQIEQKLTSIYNLLATTIDNIDSNNHIVPLGKFYLETKEELRIAEESVEKAEENEKDSAEAQADLEDPFYPILGYRGEKMTVRDGQYNYNVIILEKATQSNEHGHQEVSLGNYHDIEEKENGDFIWKFHDGQYCHNFGPRTAHVHVKCGPENKLLSAREPSTCFYELHAESPLACTQTFARSNGLDQL